MWCGTDVSTSSKVQTSVLDKPQAYVATARRRRGVAAFQLPAGAHGGSPEAIPRRRRNVFGVLARFFAQNHLQNHSENNVTAAVVLSRR